MNCSLMQYLWCAVHATTRAEICVAVAGAVRPAQCPLCSTSDQIRIAAKRFHARSGLMRRDMIGGTPA
jgi:hypothetical protein